MNTNVWYAMLIKPSWAPPAWIFGLVWPVLYIVIAVTFNVVFFKAFKKRLSWTIALPFALNLIFNLAFTPIQFGLRNNLLAAADIIFVLGTLVWSLLAIWPFEKWIAYANLPYLIWVSFATVLQLTIVYLN